MTSYSLNNFTLNLFKIRISFIAAIAIVSYGNFSDGIKQFALDEQVISLADNGLSVTYCDKLGRFRNTYSELMYQN